MIFNLEMYALQHNQQRTFEHFFQQCFSGRLGINPYAAGG